MDIAFLLLEVASLRNEVCGLKQIRSEIKEILVDLRRYKQSSIPTLQDAHLPSSNSAQLVTSTSADGLLTLINSMSSFACAVSKSVRDG